MTGFEGLNQAQLKLIYSDFVVYRDRECNGWAGIGIVDFYMKHRNKYDASTASKKRRS